VSGNDDVTGRGTADDWHIARVGIRTDWNATSRDLLSWTSEGYHGRSGETVMSPTLIPPFSRMQNSDEATSGFFSIARWNRQFEKGRELQGHLYFDHTNRDGLLFGEKRDSAVLEIQYRFPFRSSQDIVAGAGIRHNSYDFTATNFVVVTPANPNDTGYNAFVQDEFRLISNRLAFTVGVDFEHNALSENSVDLLPSGRLMLTINERNHLWTAVTKALSTPSYEQTGANVTNAAPIVPPGTPENPTPVPLITTVVGNRAIKSERLVAYEIGDRTQLGSSVTLDTTLYLHDYQSLRSESTRAVFCAPTMVSVYVDPLCVLNASYVDNQLQFANAARGHSSGIEMAADWVPSTQFRLRVAYTYFKLSLQATRPDPILANVIKIQQGQSPLHQLSLRQDLSITRALDVNLTARYVDRLATVPIPAYWSADANIVWRPASQWELSLTGRNLLQSSHAEYVSELSDVVPTVIDRTIGARIRWTF
jgi:iron complex outermembrane receptor protein